MHVEHAVANPAESVFLLDRQESSDHELPSEGSLDLAAHAELNHQSTTATTPTHVQPPPMEELKLEEEEIK